MFGADASMAAGENASAGIDARVQQRIPGLDGLRGVAVSLVLAVHFVRTPESGPWSLVGRIASSGWVGVDLFFVLSGFLITGILLDTRGSPDYFRRFYWRRALRILPLYYGFIALVVLLPRAWPLSSWLGGEYLASHQGWFWAYGMNWLMAGEAARGLDAVGAAAHGFGTLWSLAIEEQFYLFWPLLIALAPRRWMLKTVAAFALLSAGLRILLASRGVPIAALYAATPTRIDGLAIGAALAVLDRRGGLALYRRQLALAVCGTALVLAGAVIPILHSRHANALLFSIVEFAVSLAFGMILVQTLAGAGWWHRAMANPVLRMLGKYSYAIYLFQAPVQHAMLGAGLSPERIGYPGFMVLGVAIVFLLSVASWHLWEVQFLRLKDRPRRAAMPEAAV